MASTFRELTQQFVAELGIGGANNGASVPTTVANQTGHLWNAANWIKWAHSNICALYHDYHFLHVEYSESLTVGSRNVPAHSGTEIIKKWDRDSFYLNVSTDGTQLDWMDWPSFRKVVLPGYSNRGNSKPSTFTIKPDNTVLLDNPSDSAYTLSAEFWKKPTVLTNDDDTPDIPEEFERIITCEAAIKYANKEAAAEIIQGMEAEYIMLLDGLTSTYLPGHEHDRLGADDRDLTVDIPGF